MDFITTSRLAKQAGVSIQTIYFYERRMLLPTPVRSRNGHRRFPPETITHILFIRQAQVYGFTLKEIAELRKCLFGEKRDCLRGRDKIRRKIKEMSEMNIILRKHSAQLKKILTLCKKGRPHNRCHLLDLFVKYSGSR